MKVLHIYRNPPKEDTQKLVEIVSRDRETDSFILYDADPDYDQLVEKLINADQAICWW